PQHEGGGLNRPARRLAKDRRRGSGGALRDGGLLHTVRLGVEGHQRRNPPVGAAKGSASGELGARQRPSQPPFPLGVTRESLGGITAAEICATIQRRSVRLGLA